MGQGTARVIGLNPDLLDAGAGLLKGNRNFGKIQELLTIFGADGGDGSASAETGQQVSDATAPSPRGGLPRRRPRQ
jgi:hypothetical protein